MVFVLGLLLAASGFLSPPAALRWVSLSVDISTSFRKRIGTVRSIPVADLGGRPGFRHDLDEVIRAGRRGFFYTLLSIGFALILAWRWVLS